MKLYHHSCAVTIGWALTVLFVTQYAIDEAKRTETVDVDAFVDAARTHGFGMWKLDCRSG